MKVAFNDLRAVNEPIRPELEKAISKVIDQSDYILGHFVESFEASFSKYIGVKYGIGCSSGTDALELALRAIGTNEDDEVLIPANTWVSAAEVTKIIGAKPVFVDVDANTFNVDFKELEKKISARTKAIVATHLYGRPLDMDRLHAISSKSNIKIIEDCAHAHGAHWKGKKLGSFGDLSCFSFYPTKNLGGLGDSGAVLTNSEEYAEKLKILRNHGQLKRDEHITLSRNYRMDDIQASVLNVKLEYLDKWNEERRVTAQYYINELADFENVEFEKEMIDGHVYHQFVLMIEERETAIQTLKQAGIETKIHYPHIIPSMKPFFENDWNDNYLISSSLSRVILSLPIYPGLAEEHIKLVCDSIKSSF
ncbi:MAG: DegT/DnrJ/EryC1/StrS family aminotransferase [Bacteroidota bacterium]